MELDAKAARFTQVKWNSTHTSFIAVCPGSNGKPHNIACGPKTSCLGYPKCPDEVIGKFFANGHVKVSEVRGPAETPRSPAKGYGVPPDLSVNGNGKVQRGVSETDRAHNPVSASSTLVPATDLTSWKLKLYNLGKQIFEQADNPSLLASSARDQLIETTVTDFRNAISAKIPAILPLPEQSETEREEDLYNVAGAVVDAFQKQYQLPAIQNSVAQQLLSSLPNLTKTTVEVLDWNQMRTRRAAHTRDWVVEGMLARRETSSWSGKVEAGKTTLMRELTMAIIRGEPFLGRNTVKGRVFYAMLDADGEDVTYDEFAKLGFTDADSEWCKFMFEPNMAQIENGLEQFVKILKDFEPALVIIDPYPRLKVIEDFHSYTNTYLMGMLSEVAKMIDAQLALPGHIPRGRSDDDEVATAGFGSISFSGGVNARFVVTNRNGIHTVRSSKGKAAGFVPLDAEYVLQLNHESGRISLGEPFSWKDKGRAAADPVASFLAANGERPFDLTSLAREIHLQKSVVRTALGNLFNEGRIRREGEGLKKSPFIYSSRTYQGALTMEEVRRE